MEILNQEFIQQQLNERREKLQGAVATSGQNDALLELLKQVDIALEKIANGTFGICETCNDTIEPDRLAIDPFIRNCLSHLTC